MDWTLIKCCFRSVSTTTTRSSMRKFCPVEKNITIPDAISIYTDGSCVNNGKNNAISSIGIYVQDQNNLNVGEVLESSTTHTNQRAELMAISRAVELALNLKSPVRIFTDSFYAYSGFTKWIYGWVSQGRSMHIKNFDIFNSTMKMLSKSKHTVYITHIPGHSGLIGNENADKLARSAITDYLNSQKSINL